MIFEASYPALVTAKPPRRPSETRCVVERRASVELPDIPVEDAPHVMTVHGNYVRQIKDWGGPVPVRLSGGRYYRPIMTVEEFAQTLASPLASQSEYSSHDLARREIFFPIRLKISKALDGYQGRAMKPWPTDIEHMLRSHNGSKFFSAPGREFEKASARIKLDEAAEAEARSYGEFFVKGLEKLAVIDGNVWTETLEPVYCVSMSGHMSSAFPDALVSSPYKPMEVRDYDGGDHFFAADCRDEALEFVRQHFDTPGSVESMLATTKDSIEVHDPGGLSGNDTILMGLYAAAMELRGVIDGIPLSNRGHAVREALLSALSESDVVSGIYGDLEEPLVAFLDIDKDELNFLRRNFKSQTVDNFRLHLARQDNRTFGISFGTSPAP